MMHPDPFVAGMVHLSTHHWRKWCV